MPNCHMEPSLCGHFFDLQRSPGLCPLFHVESRDISIRDFLDEVHIGIIQHYMEVLH